MINEHIKKLSCLIIEPFDAYSSMVKSILKRYQFAILRASDSLKGAQSQLASMKFDIILCNYSQADNQNGQQFLEILTKNCELPSDTIFILYSDKKPNQFYAENIKPSATAVLPVPFSHIHIDEILAPIVEKRVIFAEVNQTISLRRYEQALKACDLLLFDHQDMAIDIAAAKVNICLQSNDSEKLERILTSASQLDDAIELKIQLVEYYLAKNKFKKAQKIAEDLNISDSECTPVYAYLYTIYRHTDELELAYQVMDHAVNRFPNVLIFQRNLTQIAYQLKHYESARIHAMHSLHLATQFAQPQLDDYVVLAQSFLKLEDFSNTLKTTAKAAKAFSIDNSSHLRLIESLVYSNPKMIERGLELFIPVYQKYGQPSDTVPSAMQEDYQQAHELFHTAAEKKLDKAQVIEDFKTEADIHELNRKGVLLYTDGHHKEGLDLILCAADMAQDNLTININAIKAIIDYVKKVEFVNDKTIVKMKTYINRAEKIDRTQPDLPELKDEFFALYEKFKR